MAIKDNDNLDFLDTISLLSFILGIINLQENLGQSDKQDLQRDLSEKSDVILAEIHQHLEEQDRLLNEIWSKLNEKN